MGQTTDQIASGIHQTRDALKSNLEELETRVKSAVDWRNQFRRHPAAMIAVAMVGGMLLAAMMAKRSAYDE